MKCKSCPEDKVKNPIVRETTVRFVDDKGRLWNGKQCPDCYKAYNKERMRLSRLPKASLAPSDI